jgi:microcystin-dependent protein
MVYTPHSWVELTGTGANKTTWLNNLETQYDEVVSYYTTTLHDSQFYTEGEWYTVPFYNPGVDGSGSGFVAETLDGYSAATIMGSAVAAGTVVIWGSSLASIPSGWHLCDGRDANTPDLRGKFPVTAGSSYVLGATGGSATVSSSASVVTIGTHNLTIAEMPSHSHTGIIDYNDTQAMGVYSYSMDNGAPVANYPSTGNAGSGAGHTHSGSTIAAGQGTTNNNLPSYRAYCYIVKE